MRGDLLDLILIGLAVAFGISGYRQGFIIGALSFVGFVGGAFLGVAIAPPIANAVVDGHTERALLAIVIVFLAATIGQFASSTLGAVVRSHVTWEPAKVADAVGGTFASALSVLVVVWLIGGLLAHGPFPPLSQQVNNSLLLATVDQTLPEAAKDWRRRFKEFIDTSEFPQVFEAIGGGQFVDVPPPDQGVLRGNRLERARHGIVKVQGTAPSCRKRIEGTGFVYANDRIMTNAHVVAGVTQELRITDYEGESHAARVVLYNPDRDIAVLYVPGLSLPALRFDGTAEKGEDAIIAGYPRGKGFTPLPARIRIEQDAEGYEIYNRKKVVREVYAIRGLVQPGNSGGPLLTTDGRVFGVIFAAATDQPDTGYVLTAKEVTPDAEAGARAVSRVDTQDCD
ncbi:acid resistance periplasmic serine protease MarP [Microtetraspora sp. NBRC 13810]|uniref:MarP family serine protease n=1 Tax=Microtetraspora sp. NBRC 13810 TaxID=3030990 RepID=UPI00255411D7|nr:MarP family serine protease [Microtetraspora sp. NBRC 13810]GLW08955.1 acid resistance periplasmic serine protease MarP [Microtetraspora sp. NBRC 13810]